MIDPFRLFLIAGTTAALAACGSPEAVESPPADDVLADDDLADDDLSLAEDADDGTVADEMDSGVPDIQEGGGRAVGAADNPNEPVIPDDVDTVDRDPAEVR
ncbi:MAG: hypothetical protein AAF205_08735 [Pseudomonadota bacterium]